MRFSEFLSAGKPKGSLDDAGFIPLEVRGEQGRRAGLFTRAISAMIDLLATIVVMSIVWAGTFVILWVIRPVEIPTMPSILWFVLGGVVLLWLSWSVAYATNGRSLGSWVMGIRVVNREGTAMGWFSAALRAAMNIAFPVGLLWVIPSPSNRSVQDVILRSSVVYAWTSRIEARTV